MRESAKRKLPEMAISERASADFSVFARVERETLQDQVYLQLRQALMAGRFQPGQAFTLRSVAEALGVSHMPVRSAMQRLGAEGALEAPPSGRTLIVPELRKANLQELRDIRVEIEGFAAQRAADRVSGEELIQIERRAHLMQAAAIVGDLDAYIQENWAFHTAVYRASHMDLLLGLIEGLWLRIGPYVRLMVPDRAAMIASMPNHHEIYRALRDRDGAGARESIAADLLESSHHLEAVLPQ